MECRQITLAEANAFVIEHHRHHGEVRGHKWSLGAYDGDGKLVGVAICGRPVARALDDGNTIEVNRLCTDGTRNACSFLYGAAAREAKRRGYGHIITYILASESGASLYAADWSVESFRCGHLKWDSTRDRKRKEAEQISLFEKKIPPREYKVRFGRRLR